VTRIERRDIDVPDYGPDRYVHSAEHRRADEREVIALISRGDNDPPDAQSAGRTVGELEPKSAEVKSRASRNLDVKSGTIRSTPR